MDNILEILRTFKILNRTNNILTLSSVVLPLNKSDNFESPFGPDFAAAINNSLYALLSLLQFELSTHCDLIY